MPKTDIAYRKPDNSFEKFLSWTNEKKILAKEIKKEISENHSSFLDVGAGNGELTKLISDSFKTVSLIEPSKVLFAKLKSLFPTAILSNSSIESVTITDNYDFILASHVFIYIKNPENIIANLYNHLNKGGKLIILMLNQTAGYQKYINHFAAQVCGPTNSDEYHWQHIVEFLNKQKLNYSLKDVTTYIEAPSLEDFMSINDFNFNTDVSYLSFETLENMRKFLGQFVRDGKFKIDVKHKFIEISKD